MLARAGSAWRVIWGMGDVQEFSAPGDGFEVSYGVGDSLTVGGFRVVGVGRGHIADWRWVSVVVYGILLDAWMRTMRGSGVNTTRCVTTSY